MSNVIEKILNEPHESDCLCVPCESPAYGAPGRDHCAACCYGLLIESYSHDCPIEEHQEWAHRQFPLDRMAVPDSRKEE